MTTEEPSTHSYHEPINQSIQPSHHFSFKTLTVHYPPKWSLLFRFPKLKMYSLLLYYMHATCLYHLPSRNYVNLYVTHTPAQMRPFKFPWYEGTTTVHCSHLNAHYTHVGA